MAALLKRHWPRILVTLVPVLLLLLHATGASRRPLIDGLDYTIYDWRLRLTMPARLDPRIVIVDIDDASLQVVGQWPWGRDKLARLSTELMERQQAAVLAFDMVFPEADRSSGLESLRELARGPGAQALAAELPQLAERLDYDDQFARALKGHPVVLGYYLTQGSSPLSKGELPPPALPAHALPADRAYATFWNGWGSNIAPLAAAARSAGFINAVVGERSDGLLRSAPLLAYLASGSDHAGFYESLGLAAYRLASGGPALMPVLAAEHWGTRYSSPLVAVQIGTGAPALRVPLTERAGMLVPYIGPGGPAGGSYQYISAADVLNGGLGAGELRGKIVLVGTTAPGLQDLRPTPVGANFPGVEVHANVISALLDRRLLALPDYAPGYEVAMLVLVGLTLALGLSLLAVGPATVLLLGTLALVVGLNAWLFLAHGLVLPVASALAAIGLCFSVNMAWGYLVEARQRRSLADLFGTYVPPQLVEKMLEDPSRYSMRAESKELTVLFCDMRGFTALSEKLTPTELQDFLNTGFSRLTEIISRHGGTVDKYMGDCVMAFWGAPVDDPQHATHAVRAAVEMARLVQAFSDDQRNKGLPEVSVGIGLNTGVMSVGDMGSAVRRSYTVVGDAVNLAARMESLGTPYGVAVVASQATRDAAPAFAWQELDCVRVRGRQQHVTIHTPLGLRSELAPAALQALDDWSRMLGAVHAQDYTRARVLLDELMGGPGAKKVLYRLYDERIASMESRPSTPPATASPAANPTDSTLPDQ